MNFLLYFIIFIKISTIENIYTMDNMNNMDESVQNTKYINILHSYANQISALLITTNADTMIVVKRIFHIINIFLRCYKINTFEKKIKFTSIVNSISYAPPWDEEDVIFDHLENLCDYLSYYYPYNNDISTSVLEDIKNIKIEDEIKKILLLDVQL